MLPRVLLGLLLITGLACAADRDADGVADSDDRCPHSPLGHEVDASGCSELEYALDAGAQAVRALPSFQAGDVWVLKQVAKLAPSLRLEPVIETQVAELIDSPFARQLDPSLPARPLPPYPGQGIRKLYAYIQAPFGEPHARAVEWIRAYLDHDAHGYVLTHQFLVLPWAEESGVVLPRELRDRQMPLLARIEREQGLDHGFSDLYAERAALLLHFGEPARAAAREWVDTILAAQGDDGAWRDVQPSVIEFDGQQSRAFHPPSHTSAFALWALVAYRGRE